MKPTWTKTYHDPLIAKGTKVIRNGTVRVEGRVSVRDTMHPEQTFSPTQLKRIWNAAHYTNALKGDVG